MVVVVVVVVAAESFGNPSFGDERRSVCDFAAAVRVFMKRNPRIYIYIYIGGEY